MRKIFSLKNVSYNIVLSFFVMAIIGFFLPEEMYGSLDIKGRMMGISFNHILGTDILGRDVFLRIIRGGYNVFLVAIPSVIFGVIVGGFPAILVSRNKTNFRYVIGGIMDVIFAFPVVLVALVIVARIGSSPIVATISLGLFFVPVFYRVVYMSSLAIWQTNFVSSARVSGKSNYYIATRHVLPNIAPIVISAAQIQFAMAILAEAGLGYLGLSVESPEPTWGSMMLDVQNAIFINPLFVMPIGVVLAMFVWGFISFGDSLKRDL